MKCPVEMHEAVLEREKIADLKRRKDVHSSNDDNNSQNNTNMPPVTDTPVSSYLKNMMSPKQQEIYNDFLSRLDEIDFNNTNNE